MKGRVKTLFVSLAALLMMLGIVSQAQADMFAYFVYPQSLTITYNTSANSANGNNIVMQDFTVGSTTYSGAIFSFGFSNGLGTLLVTDGSDVIFSGNISDAEIIPIEIGGSLRYYQIAGNVEPSQAGSPLQWFDFGQINVTFLPNNNSNFTGGYFQTFGEGSKTPIPGAAWLLGTGLFGLIAIRRRRKA